MAAYRADIEIGVRGQRALEQLRSSINQTATAVDSLNDVMGARGALSQSIQNYTNNLNRAAASLRNVGAGIPAETRAIREYVRALGEANAARARQNYLIAQETANQRQVRPGTAAYGQQMPALPPTLIRGQQIQQNWNRFFTEAAQVAQELQGISAAKQTNIKTSWNRFFTEAQEVAVELTIQAQKTAAAIRTKEGAASAAARQRLAEEAATRQRIRDAGFGQQGPQLPLQQVAAQQVKANDAQKRLNNLLASAQILEQKIAQNRAKGIDVVEQQAQIQRVLNSLQQEGVNTTTQYLTAVDKVLNSLRNELRLQKAILDTQKSQTTQTTKKASKSRTADIAGNAIIGGAFPLLFGQGLGASIGGGAGGAIGGAMGGNFGFGLSLLGTAGGAALDQIVISAQDFAKSMRQGGDAVGYLEQKLGYLDPNIKKQISNLQSSGQTAAAAEMAFQELAKTVGEDGARAFLQAGKNTDLLSRSLKLLVDRFVAAGFAANKFFEEAKYGKGGSFMDALPAQFRAAPAPQDSATTSAFKEKSAQLSRDTDSLRTQLQLTTASAKADLDRFVTLSKTAAQKEYENELAQIAIQLKNKEISLEQNKQLITNANLQLSIKYGEIERQRVQELQRRQEEAARAAKQAAEEAARAAEQALKARLTVERDMYEQLRKGIDIRVREAEFYKGTEAGLSKQLELIRSNYQLQVQSLDVERELAVVEAQKTGTAQKVVDLYDLKLAQLNSELNLETDILSRKVAQTQLSERQAQIDKQRAQIATIRGVTQTSKRLQLETSFAPDSSQLREQLSLLEQNQRVYQELLPEQEKLRDIQREINSGALDDRALQIKQQELGKQQDFIQQLTQELSLRTELEKRQFRLNELYKQYGFIGDEVSATISSSITGLITGTQTVAEAFSKMFENIGKAFINMATQMLAQQLIFTVFRSILGAVPGGSALEPNSPGGNAAFMDRVFSTPLAGAGYAEGGFVTGPTNALIGEGGQPEYVIPASKMRSAMGRYAAGARGSSVIPSAGGDGGPNQPGGIATSPIDVRYTVERINSVDYVTADQFQAGMQQAAAQGAQRGEQRALRSLQQSTSVRSKVGLR